MKLHHWPLAWLLMTAIWAGSAGYLFGREQTALAAVSLANSFVSLRWLRACLRDLERFGEL